MKEISVKEIILEVAKLYVEQYQKENRIYKALAAENIYVSIEGEANTGLEKILNSVNEDLCGMLCEFAENGFVELVNPDECIDSIEEIVTICMNY